MTDTPRHRSSQPRIDADAIYGDGELRLLLGITGSATARARRDGRLRFTRQGRRVLYRGRWILDWLERDADQPIGGGR